MSLKHLTPRLTHGLPPSPRHPAIVQTIGGRRFPYSYLEHCQACCGDTFTLYPLDRAPMVFLANPNDIRAVLTGDPDELHPGEGGHTIAPLIGNRSFMLQEGEDHRSGRKTITPAFHRHIVAEQTQMLADVVDQAVESWPTARCVPIYPQIRALTLTIILRVIFTQESPQELTTLHLQLTRTLAISDSLLLQGPRLRKLPGWRAIWQRFLHERAELDRLLYEIIDHRGLAKDQPVEHRDLLDTLLADDEQMGRVEIRDNLQSMILAGHETTTGQLAWALLLLAHHPDIQQRLYEELHAGNETYLHATIEETMRRRPVFVFTIPRVVHAPVQIGDWTYRPPVHLAPCTYLMHHDPGLYENPRRFEPDRFLGGRPAPRIWQPWGGGRKHCLGRHFAMLEVEAVLRRVITTRRVVAQASSLERPRWRSAILVPSSGARVKLINRASAGRSSTSGYVHNVSIY
jgi:cytochrome P450